MSDRIALLKDFLIENPNDSFLLFALGKEYEAKMEDNDAISYYLQIVDLDPDYVGVYYHLGKIYERNENQDEAISTYNHGITIAKKINDKHSLGELLAAKSNLVDE